MNEPKIGDQFGHWTVIDIHTLSGDRYYRVLNRDGRIALWPREFALNLLTP